MKIFSKQKMLDRLKEEGREHLVDDEAIKIMDMLDSYPVNPNDCISK